MNWIQLADLCEHTYAYSCFPEDREFAGPPNDCLLLKNDSSIDLHLFLDANSVSVKQDFRLIIATPC